MKTIATLLTVAALSAGVPAQAITITDGDFSAWSFFSFITDDPFQPGPPPTLSSAAITRVATGGNPGAYVQDIHTVTVGDTLWSGGIKQDFAYNPATQGAITSLTLTIDLLQMSLGQTAWQLVVEQSGVRYYSIPLQGFSSTATWQSNSQTIFGAASFDTNPWAGYSGIPPNGSKPNFSATGAPIRFGFMFGNTVALGSTIVNPLGFDNFTVTTTPVPEPSCALLLACGLLVIASSKPAIRRFRR